MLINAYKTFEDNEELDESILNKCKYAFKSNKNICIGLSEISDIPDNWNVADMEFFMDIAKKDDTHWIKPGTAKAGWSIMDDNKKQWLSSFEPEMDDFDDPSLSALSMTKASRAKDSLLEMEAKRKRKAKFYRN